MIFFWQNRNFGGKRHKDWGKLRGRHIRNNPNCAVCGKKGRFRNNDVHHIIPYQIDRFKELDMDNLLTLCRKHHFLFGHLNFWRSFNKNSIIDSKYWHNKIINRP